MCECSPPTQHTTYRLMVVTVYIGTSCGQRIIRLETLLRTEKKTLILSLLVLVWHKGETKRAAARWVPEPRNGLELIQLVLLHSILLAVPDELISKIFEGMWRKQRVVDVVRISSFSYWVTQPGARLRSPRSRSLEIAVTRNSWHLTLPLPSYKCSHFVPIPEWL